MPASDAPPTQPTRTGRVLVVDDEAGVRRAMTRLLTSVGHEVTAAADAEEALALVRGGGFDAVISDIVLPGLDGIDLLRQMRAHDADVPVIMVTGGPRLETAIEAMRYGALRYLVKPVEAAELRNVVREAVQLHQMALAKREALELFDESHRYAGDRAALENVFDRALATIRLDFQPIVRMSNRTVFAYEALLRPQETSLATPSSFIDVAERLGWVHRMGREVRRMAAANLPDLDPAAKLFINLHAEDLSDPQLFAGASGLHEHPDRVVFEITERHSLTELPNVHDHVAELKRLGFQVAIDDFGSGHAGLTCFAILEPDIIKLDMDLVRDLDRVQTKRKLVQSMVRACEDLGVTVIAEGIERVGELEALRDLGCDLFQGFLFAQPDLPFTGVDWPAPGDDEST